MANICVIDAIIQSLNRAGEFNRDDQVAPAVILWPDKERQCEPVLPMLRERLPHLLTLGAYDLKSKTGPAIWLRCMIGRSSTSTPLLPEVVGLANGRCDQENVIGELKHGVHAMRMPVNDLLSNGA